MPEAFSTTPRCPLPREQVIDRYFLEHRQKVIDIAAFLDRVDRAEDTRADEAEDYRISALKAAILHLVDGEGDRARRILELFSDPTTDPIPSAGPHSAVGAYPPARRTVEQLTQLLRHGEDPLWSRLRELLQDKGLDPQQLVLAESFEDDEGLEFGIVVTPAERAFQYDLSYSTESPEDAKLEDWQELPLNAEVLECYSGITTALQKLSGA